MRNPLRNAIHALFHDPRHIAYALLHRMPWLIRDDAKYLSALYQLELGVKPDLEHPKKFSEKIQWLKLHDHNPLYTTMVDKLAVKEFVSERLGKEYVIPMIAEWDSPEQIEWEKLPNQFVLKTNHDGGGRGIVTCKDKSKFSISDAFRELKESYNKSSYSRTREWPYKNVQRRVFAEEFVNDSNEELRDYKFFCFNGKVKCYKVDFNRQVDHRANYFDLAGHMLPYGEAMCPPDFAANIHIPENIQEMIALAEKLAKDIPFVRIDFYNVDGKIYFGEITFYPASGMSKWVGDVDVDAVWGEQIVFPRRIIGERTPRGGYRI